jgi:hypothetical protein
MSEKEIPVHDLRPANHDELVRDGFKTVEVSIKGEELKMAALAYSRQLNLFADLRGVPECCKAGIITLHGTAIALRQFIPRAQLDAIFDDIKRKLVDFEPHAKAADDASRSAREARETEETHAAYDAEEAAAATKH